MNIEQEFLDEARRLLQDNGDVLIVISSVLGTEYGIVDSFEEVVQLTQSLPGRTSIFVFGGKQLPLRGVADVGMLQQALEMISEPEDFLILSLEHENFRENESFHGDMAWELECKLRDFFGKPIALGKMPPWWDMEIARDAAAHVAFLSTPLRELRVDVHSLRSAPQGTHDGLADRPGFRTKLGGRPDWIQTAETPKCPSCQETMVFIAQIDSIDHILNSDQDEYAVPAYMFGDVGMIYVFFCYECGEAEGVFQCY
jgi:hypothetical protein